MQLLRDHKQYQAAYDLLAKAAAKEPRDADLLYDQAMLAEKLDNLRRDGAPAAPGHRASSPTTTTPTTRSGYSLAERNVRLPEARQLIQKALEFAPGDPFISDSLGWVEFRMGNKAEALRILRDRLQGAPRRRDRRPPGRGALERGPARPAQAVWKEGLLLNADNETLQETLKRLRVKP